MRRILSLVPPSMARLLEKAAGEDWWEVRIRVGWPLEVRGPSGSKALGERVSQEEMEQLLGALTGYSLYAWEEQMREGFFTLKGGVRAGVTGRYGGKGPMQQATCVALRLSRELPACADGVLPSLMEDGRFLSTLILSPPCMGKTTMLRAMTGRLSAGGFAVAVCDERGELAGQILGPCDVAFLCPKAEGIPRLVRSMAPQVVVTDELGGPGDFQAVALAARCGCQVLATAHAPDWARALQRPHLGRIMQGGIFERYVLLGGAPGRVLGVLDGKGRALWKVLP